MSKKFLPLSKVYGLLEPGRKIWGRGKYGVASGHWTKKEPMSRRENHLKGTSQHSQGNHFPAMLRFEPQTQEEVRHEEIIRGF